MLYWGTLKAFTAATYLADVQIRGSLEAWLTDIPVSTAILPAQLVAGRSCIVAIPDEDNQIDAQVVAIAAADPPAAAADMLPAHKTRHQDAGDDEISVTGLSGLLADAQTPIAHALVSAYHTAAGLTAGHVLRASDATTFGFAALQAADLPAHDILSAHSYTGGAALDVFGLSAPNTLAKLTPSANPGAASALLKSDDDGRLGLVGVRVGDGDVATPSQSFLNDTDTGWYRIGADNPGIAIGGIPSISFTLGTYMHTRYSDTASTAPVIIHRRAGGTAALPTAVQADAMLGQWQARGYGATGFPGAGTGSIDFYAAENFTNAAQGTYIDLKTTPAGSTTRATRMRIHASGALWVGTTPVDVGANNLGVQGAYYRGANQVVGAQGAAVADADGSLASATTQLNALLARVRTHGLIAT